MRRHADILASGENVHSETRRYDAASDKTISMRSKEDNLDYRFLVDADLPIFQINPLRIKAIRQRMGEIPFNQKLKMSKDFGLSITDVQTIFLQRDTIPIFHDLVASSNSSPSSVFRWLYQNLYGNVAKKDLELNEVLRDHFENGKKLSYIIDLVENKKLLS